MYQGLKKTEAAADTGSTMETRGHLKNGASLKSHTSRKNFLLFGVLLFAFCAFTDKAMGQTWTTGVGHNGAPLTAELTGSGNNRTLTIKGNGLMADFEVSSDGVPWNAYLTNIKYVVVESSVQSIGNYAFSGCTNLDSVRMANSVTRIGHRSFDNCTSLQRIIISNGIITIEGEAFLNCTGLKTVIIEEGSTDLSFIRYGTSPSNYKYDWFKNCPIQTLNLKRQYTYASGGTLFSGNSYLQTLTIGRNVSSIGSYDFADCSGLTNVTLEDGATNLIFGHLGAETVFSGCPINTLYLGRNIYTGISNSTGATSFSASYKSPFYNKTTLTVLTVDNNISVVAYAFQNCINLKTVSIGNDVISIGGYAFDGCSSLSSVIIGNSVTSIGDAAFRNCTVLAGISIPNKVTSFTIGSSTFSGSGLTSITVPNIITTIGSSAFADCSNLTNVILQDGSTNLIFGHLGAETVFSGCPINTLYLGRNIYTGISNSTGATSFSASYKSPFYNKTTLKTLEVGKDMTTITDYTFQGCNGLTQITSNNPAPPTFGTNTFSGVITTIPVKVPCVIAYQSSAWGTTFSNFEQTGTCPSDPTTYTLNVLSSDIAKGHAMSTSLSSRAVLTSTWSSSDSNFPSVTTSAQFSGKALLTASAKANSVFAGWDDGNLEPIRIVDIAANKTYTAQFTSCSSSGVEEMLAEITQLKADTTALGVDNRNLQTQLTGANATITNLQGEIEEANKTISDLQTQIAECSNSDIPPNNLCSNAINLNCGATVSGTLTGATPTTIYGTYTTYPDIYYQFTAAHSGNHTITFTKTNSSDDIDVIVYQGCGSTTEITTITDNNITETTTLNCMAGINYRIRVVASGVVSGNFSIKLDCPSDIPSDNFVVINEVSWATRNVDAPGTFVANPEDAGMFYQWNRKVGWSIFDPLINSNGGTTWDSSIPTGIEWEKVNDPSPAGWRVPTFEEIEKLLDTNKVANEWTTVNGVKGSKFTDKITGESLFLPAVGYRTYSYGALIGEDSEGLYWSSTQSGSDNAYHLWFGSDYTYLSNAWHKPDGVSCRSVRDGATSIANTFAHPLQIFPNPAQTDIFIQSELPIEKVEIYTLAGTLLIVENNFTEKISVSALPRGVYLLNVYTNKGLVVSKLVKE